MKTIKLQGADQFSVGIGGDLSFVEGTGVFIKGGDFRQESDRQPAWSVQVRGPGQVDLLNKGDGQVRLLGLYRREGETFTLSFRASGGGRPETFSADEILIVLARLRR